MKQNPRNYYAQYTLKFIKLVGTTKLKDAKKKTEISSANLQDFDIQP
jgi:hypothetical protein